MAAFKTWKDIPEKVFGAPFTAGSVAAEISPELLGVGYIIGPRIASIMCAGRRARLPGADPGDQVLRRGRDRRRSRPAPCRSREMGPDEIRDAYVLYIGAGAVAAGGIISLFRSLPTIWHGIRAGLADFGAGRRATRRRGRAAHRARPADEAGGHRHAWPWWR